MNPIILAENWCSVFDFGRFLRWLCVGGHLQLLVHQHCAGWMSAVLITVEWNASFTCGLRVVIFVYLQIKVKISNFLVLLQTACISLLIRQPKVRIGLHLNWAWITAEAFKGNWQHITAQGECTSTKKKIVCFFFFRTVKVFAHSEFQILLKANFDMTITKKKARRWSCSFQLNSLFIPLDVHEVDAKAACWCGGRLFLETLANAWRGWINLELIFQQKQLG